MSMMGSNAWNGQETQMHQSAEDDFQQFLDISLPEGLQFDFQDFQAFDNASATAEGPLLQAPPPAREPLDTPMSGTEMPVLMSTPAAAAQHAQQMRAMTSAPAHASIGAMSGIPVAMVRQPAPRAPPTPIDTLSEIDAKIQYLQQQRLEHQQRQIDEQQVAFFAQQNRMVPPTPQSLEIQAGNRFYVHPDQTPQQQGIYERFPRLTDQEMAFTPLVSPAVTPLETHFPMDSQFTIPGAYFSPLASPALHAQQESSSMFEKVSGGPANTSSPGEMDLESHTGPTVTPAPASTSMSATETAKKPQRKTVTAKSRGKGNVRQSPISKPLRKKTVTTPIMNAQVLNELAESLEQRQDQPQQQLQSAPAPQGSRSSTVGATDSENGSVSPETLSDMPPPPLPSKPRSARPSPYIEPQSTAPKTALPSMPAKMSPATPASLMRLTSSNTNDGAGSGSQEAAPQEPIENFELPESVNFQQRRPALPPSPSLVTGSPVQSPCLDPGVAKHPGVQQLPSPNFARPGPTGSASQSPQLPAQVSSTTTPTGTAARKTPQLAPRSIKKRASVGSVHVSPALRPRISPNIKPLLPGGASAEDAASKLLASKSNYQNILEGNNVPGVSYPSELSTNLTSKRTSHKIAEQGRRNRINSALQEIATLLPATVPEENVESGEGEGPGGGGAGSVSMGGGEKKGDKNGPNSKASTVEMAIEYIKQLKREVAEATRRAEEAESRLRIKECETGRSP